MSFFAMFDLNDRTELRTVLTAPIMAYFYPSLYVIYFSPFQVKKNRPHLYLLPSFGWFFFYFLVFSVYSRIDPYCGCASAELFPLFFTFMEATILFVLRALREQEGMAVLRVAAISRLRHSASLVFQPAPLSYGTPFTI